MANGFAWRTECQNASAVWPVSMRPERSVIVPEIQIGRRTPNLVERFLDGEDRGFGVQRVEHGLDHDQIGAAAHQARASHRDSRAQCVEVDIAESRDRRHSATARQCGWWGPARRPQSAAVATSRFLVAGSPRKARAFFVQFRDEMLEPVIGLGNRGRIEGVRLDDVGARVEIGVADLAR